ncbi:hypothetical protein ACX4MT_17955 [Roseomonas mucosa]
MNSEKVAVICGALRDALEFSFIADRLLREKAEGKIDRIVFSTWFGEISQDHPLFQPLLRSGIELIESKSPEKGGHGNIQRQKKALFQALIQLPPDATVLKLRTDKCAVLLGGFLNRLQKPLVITEPANSVYRNKVVVVRTSSTMPFMSDDFSFLGRCDDLLRMTSQDESLLIHNARCEPTAEMMWMYAALSRSDRLLDTFYSMISSRQFSILVKKMVLKDFKGLPEVLLGFLAHYWLVNDSHYEVLRKSPIDQDVNPIRAVLDPSVDARYARDLGQYITVHADGALREAAKELDDARRHVEVHNPVEVMDSLNEISLRAGHENLLHEPIKAASCNTKSAGSESFLKIALRNHKYKPEDDREIDALENIIIREGTRLAFPRLITDIGVKYRDGDEELSRRQDASKSWLKLAAGMREPIAFRALVESYASDEEAIADPEMQRIFALQEARDPSIYIRLCRAFLMKGMESQHLKAPDMLRALRNLAQQGSMEEAEKLLAELSEQDAYKNVRV